MPTPYLWPKVGGIFAPGQIVKKLTLDKWIISVIMELPKERKRKKMKTWRLPTNIIVNEIMWVRPAVRHLFGKYFWDGDYKTLMIGDKTMKQHKAKYHEVID